MIIAPGEPYLRETRHSRELGRRVDQLVRDYQRENPDVSEDEIRTALLQLAPGGAYGRRRRALGVAAGALAGAALVVMATTGGGGFEGNTLTWRLLGGVAAACAVIFAVFRIARRG